MFILCGTEVGNKLQRCIPEKPWCVLPLCQDVGHRGRYVSFHTSDRQQASDIHIRVAKFLLQRYNNLNSSENVDGEKRDLRRWASHASTMKPFFSSWTEGEPLLVRFASE